MRLVPEGTAWTRLPCRSTNEPHPSPHSALSYAESCELFRKLNFAPQEWEDLQ